MNNKIINLLGKLVAIYFACAAIYLWLNYNGSTGNKIYFLILIIFAFLAFFPDKTYKTLHSIWQILTGKK